MKEVWSKLEGDTIITRDTILRGMIVGNTTVRAGSTLVVRGMICGNLTAEPDSTVIIHGMVNGVVENRGATVEVHGMIDAIFDTGETETTIASRAVVKRGRATA